MTKVDVARLAKVVVNGPITLQNFREPLSSFSAINLGSKWETTPALIFIIRRLGCPICRTTSILLSSIKPQLEAKGISLVGVSFQAGQELESFLQGGFFQGDLYLDPKRETYQAAKASGLTGVFNLAKSLVKGFSPAFKSRMKGVTSNNHEVSTVYSVIAAIGPGDRVLFEQRHAEEPPIPKILKSLGVAGADLEAALTTVNRNLRATGDVVVH